MGDVKTGLTTILTHLKSIAFQEYLKSVNSAWAIRMVQGIHTEEQNNYCHPLYP